MISRTKIVESRAYWIQLCCMCVMTSPGLVSLLNAGKKFLLSLANKETEALENNVLIVDERPALKRFKFLNIKLKAAELPATSNNNDTILGHLNRYIMDTDIVVCDNALDFWQYKKSCYSKLSMLFPDLVTAPAPQAYVEWIFPVCGILTAGRRKRMRKSLEIRVFHKLNKHILVKLQLHSSLKLCQHSERTMLIRPKYRRSFVL